MPSALPVCWRIESTSRWSLQPEIEHSGLRRADTSAPSARRTDKGRSFSIALTSLPDGRLNAGIAGLTLGKAAQIRNVLVQIAP